VRVCWTCSDDSSFWSFDEPDDLESIIGFSSGRRQAVLLPEYLDDYVSEENPVRVIDVFVDELDLRVLGFAGIVPEATGRPAYRPGLLLKIYIYGYINQIGSSRRLEREARRNVEMMWLTGRLAPDFKTIADFRKDNGPAIRASCRQFIALCRRLDLFAQPWRRPAHPY
jgi:transposase